MKKPWQLFAQYGDSFMPFLEFIQPPPNIQSNSHDCYAYYLDVASTDSNSETSDHSQDNNTENPELHHSSTLHLHTPTLACASNIDS